MFDNYSIFLYFNFNYKVTIVNYKKNSFLRSNARIIFVTIFFMLMNY